MKQKKQSKKESSRLEAILNQPSSKTDPLGSYTGKPRNRYEVPVQDADDL